MSEPTTNDAPADAAMAAAAPPVPAEGAPAAGNKAPESGEEAGHPIEGEGKPGDEANGGSPEAYDLKMPEGVEVDAKLLETFTPKFKELGLSNEKAQELADLYTEARKAEVEAATQQWTTTQDEWVTQGKTDKEIGGNVYETTVRSARSALDRFGTPALREALNMSGMGNHPEMLRLMARVGQAISEDNPPPSRSADAKRDTASILYPDQ